jgi:hypothetical protein|nr:MAG TPA: hypothetical protein [Caudoviricetes sp.]DAZ33996.1 MAG TPA: hypothetical protein [Caudoviricetes sp.]
MKKVTENKTPEVKENLNIITVYDYTELAYKFIHHLYHTDKTVALIAGRDLVEYIFDEVMDLDETSIWRVDLTDDDPDIEYMLSVTDEGYVTVIPLDDYGDLYDADIFYIDMDGSVSQDVIEECKDLEREVILFGLTDECDENCEDCAELHDGEMKLDVETDEDDDIHGFTVSKSEDGKYTSHTFYTSEKLSEKQMRDFLKLLGY